MNEFELIERLTRTLPGGPEVAVGVGDDCAVLDLGLPRDLILFKTDAIVEGVHFLAADPPEKVGHKALARVLSDIAAMAGTPSACLVTLGLPEDFAVARVERIYAGLTALARRCAVAVVGGETTRALAGMFLSLALLGRVPRDRCILRRGAQPGDALFVTGTLGGSLKSKHLDFEPRLGEARWLADHFQIHSMIDLSDGLAGDLPHLLRAGGMGAELLAGSIPISQAARQQARARSSAKTPLVAALTDGEDFELLFTVASRDAVPLLDAWKDAFPKEPLTCIGKIKAEPGLTLRDKNGIKPLGLHGYMHFS